MQDTDRAYDSLGRETADAVTLPAGNPEHIDTTLMEHTTSYNAAGGVYQETSYATVGGSTVVSQIQDVWGNLLGSFLDH